jgi:hypothetical protein
MPIDLSVPFRGSTAVAAGVLTPGVLRGRRYRRLFPDVYAPALLEVDLALRARAAGVLVAGRGSSPGTAPPSCGVPRAGRPMHRSTCCSRTTVAATG